MTDGLTDLLGMINGGGRKVYVAEKLIDLSDLGLHNDIYILQLPDGSTAAGGRGGGFGERRIVRVYHFEIGGGACKKIGEIDDDEQLDSLDLPYHATAMPVLDPQGNEKLVSGVVDAEFASSYKAVLG